MWVDLDDEEIMGYISQIDPNWVGKWWYNPLDFKPNYWIPSKNSTSTGKWGHHRSTCVDFFHWFMDGFFLRSSRFQAQSSGLGLCLCQRHWLSWLTIRCGVPRHSGVNLLEPCQGPAMFGIVTFCEPLWRCECWKLCDVTLFRGWINFTDWIGS